ncbi:MAG: thioredoxin domain-containing protein [Nocardioides sp.]
MSQRNKSERAAALLAEQQRKERARQFAIIGGVAAVVLLIGVLTWLAMSRDTTGGTVATNPGGTTDYAVVVGDADAPTTVTIYEDMQCPVCAQFEAGVADQLAAAVDAGKVKVEYRIVSFLDRASTNEYSSRAANAAFAVSDQAGEKAFQAFHDLLFANQPAENGPGHEDAQLIAYAVEAGADEASITPLIEDKAFEQYIVNATDQMSKNKVTGTPTVFIDGKRIEGSPQDAVDAVLAAIG